MNWYLKAKFWEFAQCLSVQIAYQYLIASANLKYNRFWTEISCYVKGLMNSWTNVLFHNHYHIYHLILSFFLCYEKFLCRPFLGSCVSDLILSSSHVDSLSHILLGLWMQNSIGSHLHGASIQSDTFLLLPLMFVVCI